MKINFKKISYLSFLVIVISVFLYQMVFAGINIGDTLDVGTNTYSSAIANQIRGGFHQVQNVSERDGITADRRVEGMVVFTKDSNEFYQLFGGVDNVNWKKVTILDDNNQSISGIKTFVVFPETSGIPSTDNQLTNKAYVDAFVLGLSWKAPVATFADIALTYPAPNNGWAVLTLDDNKGWVYNGVDAVWVQFNASQTYSAGAGLNLAVNTFSLDYNSSIFGIDTNKLIIINNGVTNDMLAGNIAVAKLQNPSDSGVFLRGDGTWATPPVAGGITLSNGATNYLSLGGSTLTANPIDLSLSENFDNLLPVEKLDIGGNEDGKILKLSGGVPMWLDETGGGAGAGEVNTASNAGLIGSGIFKQKSGYDLIFKKLFAGAGISITESDDYLTITNTSGGGGGIIISGTTNYLSKFNALGDNVVNSQIFDNGTLVGINSIVPEFRLTLDKGAVAPDGGILAIGTFGSGNTLATAGAGARMIWYPRKAAFRAGKVAGAQWDDANIGDNSFAAGASTLATARSAVAIGLGAEATASEAVAFGSSSKAQGANSFAVGQSNIASGINSMAIGYQNVSSGLTSYTFGNNLTSSTNNTITLGSGISTGIGINNNIANSFMVGLNSTIPTLFVGGGAGAGTLGNVGVGTTTPGARLEINGQIKITGGIPGAGKVLTSDAVGLASWTTLASGSSPFKVVAGLVQQDTGVSAYSDSFVFGSPTMDYTIDRESRFFFNKQKSAFRAGFDDSGVWDDANIGDQSIAFGSRTTASGFRSTAFGLSSTASGNMATSFGNNTTASGSVSTAFGGSSLASGDYSTAFGQNTNAQAYDSTVLGRYNIISGTLDTWVSTEPLFVIGNGTSSVARANALTIYKNGNMDLNGQIKIIGGTPGAGKVLTSDAVGLASWTTPASSGWNLTGNTLTGTLPASPNEFIGSTNNADFIIKVNNQQAGRLSSISGTFVGYQAGDANTGLSNTAFGTLAFTTNTSGIQNTAIGHEALDSNTTANNNTAVGYQTLSSNNTGTNNTAVGSNTLYTNTSGVRNTAMGTEALNSNNQGSDNVANGYHALFANTYGLRNTAIGSYALPSNTGVSGTTDGNTAIGWHSLFSSISAQYNVALGAQALSSNTQGDTNTAVGASAGFSNLTGTSNVFLGYNAGYFETGSNKLYIDNSNTTTPLIYGDFSTDTLTVNGQLKITGGTPGVGKVLTSDAVGLASWTTPTGLPSGTSGQTLRNDGANWVANSNIFNDGTLVGINSVAPEFRLTLDKGAVTPDGGILAIGAYGSGNTLTTTGAGTRMIWYSKKAAFRAGRLDAAGGTYWDDSNIGDYSFAAGFDTLATARSAVAIGLGAEATASEAVAFGSSSKAQGANSFAVGYHNTASGSDSMAIGKQNVSSSGSSYTFGANLTASAVGSMTLGVGLGSGINSINNNIANSLMVGFNSNIPTLFVGGGAGAGTLGNVGIGSSVLNTNTRLTIKDGHLGTQQTTAPTITLGAVATAVSFLPAAANVTDVAGDISITTTNNTGTGAIITFNKTYAVAPKVILTPTNAAASQRWVSGQVYVTSTVSNFTVSYGANAGADTKTYSYFVIETQ